MRTMKLALVLAFVSFAVMTFADDGPQRKALTIKMSLDKAMSDKSLKTEILQQINRSLILEKTDGLYYAQVRYRNNSYVIFGKYKEWKAFFDMANWRVVEPGKEIIPELTD